MILVKKYNNGYCDERQNENAGFWFYTKIKPPFESQHSFSANWSSVQLS
jgi:hypothetical protein